MKIETTPLAVEGPLAATGATYSFHGETQCSLGELLLAVSLERATALEKTTVGLLEEVEEQNVTLEAYAEVARMILAEEAPEAIVALPVGYTCESGLTAPTLTEFLTQELGIETPTAPWSYSQRRELYEAVQSLMEPLTVQSEEMLIDLQALVNARDSFYNLATNMLKEVQRATLNNIPSA